MEEETLFEIADADGDTLSFCKEWTEKHGDRLNFWLIETYGKLGHSDPKAVIALDLKQSRKFAEAILSVVDRLEGVKL
ncbi:MAG: hypothetical protein E6R03_06210 [Hyphomicrobiaceae bacterium]|nr:MAG: hypothetical protein E6R03_06210 [Hyphomicrobiaceae bacterium]